MTLGSRFVGFVGFVDDALTAPDESRLRRWLEFHDSELVSLMHTADAAVLELGAYVHRWEYLEGGWRGSGWTQRVRITVFDQLVPLPFAFAGSVRLEIDMNMDARFESQATAFVWSLSAIRPSWKS